MTRKLLLKKEKTWIFSPSLVFFLIISTSLRPIFTKTQQCVLIERANTIWIGTNSLKFENQAHFIIIFIVAIPNDSITSLLASMLFPWLWVSLFPPPPVHRSHDMWSGLEIWQILTNGPWHSLWVFKLLIYYIKEWKKLQAIPLMFFIKSKYARTEYDDLKTAQTSLISLKQCEPTKGIKWRTISKDKKDPRECTDT